MVVRAERSEGSGRDADDRGRLALPCALPVRPRSDVHGVLQRRGDGAVVLGRDEENRVRASDPITKRYPGLGWAGLQVLVVQLQTPDLDDLQAETIGSEGGQRGGHHSIERALAEAPHHDGDVTLSAHGITSQNPYPIAVSAARAHRSAPSGDDAR